MKKIIAMLLALVMVFALVACSNADDKTPDDDTTPSTSTPAETPDEKPEETKPAEDEKPAVELTGEPFVIGHIADLTGAEALTGKEASNAMAFAVKYIEANGGIGGRPIKLIEEDAKSSTPEAVNAARKLVENDNVDCIVGPTLVPHKGAVASFAQTAGVPVVFYNPTPAGMINEWVVGASGTNPQMPTCTADYIYHELGYRKVYTLTKDDTGGKSYMEPFVANFTALGGEILDQAWVPSPTPDFMPYLNQFTDPEADCLVAWTSASDAINLWRAWYDLGLNEKLPIVANMHGAFTDSFICDALEKINPDLVEEILGTISVMTWAYNIDSPENNAYVAAWQENFKGTEYEGYPIGNNIPGAAVQVLMLIDAAVEALDAESKELTHENLRDALLAADITGPEGRTVFEGSNGATKDVYIVKVIRMENGQYNYEMVKTYKDVPPTGLAVG